MTDDPRSKPAAGAGTNAARIGSSEGKFVTDPSGKARRHALVSRVSVTIVASGLAGAVAGAIVFAGLWMTTALPLGPSDRVIELFTNAPPVSVEALRGGAVVAALLGFLVGAVSGAVYELLHG